MTPPTTSHPVAFHHGEAGIDGVLCEQAMVDIVLRTAADLDTTADLSLDDRARLVRVFARELGVDIDFPAAATAGG